MKAVQEIANMPNSNPWLIDEYIPKYKYRKKISRKTLLANLSSQRRHSLYRVYFRLQTGF